MGDDGDGDESLGVGMGDENFGSESMILLSLCKASRDSGCMGDMLCYVTTPPAAASQA